MVSKPDSNKARLNRHKRVRGKTSRAAECPGRGEYGALKKNYA